MKNCSNKVKKKNLKLSNCKQIQRDATLRQSKLAEEEEGREAERVAFQLSSNYSLYGSSHSSCTNNEYNKKDLRMRDEREP